MFQMLSLKQGRPGRRRHSPGLVLVLTVPTLPLENGKLTIDVFAADGNDEVAAFSACEITIAGDALAEVQTQTSWL